MPLLIVLLLAVVGYVYARLEDGETGPAAFACAVAWVLPLGVVLPINVRGLLASCCTYMRVRLRSSLVVAPPTNGLLRPALPAM